MLTLNQKPIKFKRNLTLFVETINDLENVKINSNIEFSKFLKLKNILSYEDCINILKIYKDNICSKQYFYKYIKDVDYILDIKQLFIYLKFKEENPNNDGWDLDFYINKFGKDIGHKKFNDRRDNFAKNHKPQLKEFWLKKGYSEDESIKKSENFKLKTSTTKESFIKKHGEEKGLEIFKKFQETSKHTEEKYIEKFGEIEGIIKWNEYCNKKRENSVFNASYWINKGYSEEESEIMRKEFHKMNLNTSSVDYWISKGLSEEDSILRIREIYNKKRVAFGKASKESVHFLRSLLRYLKFQNLEYRLGVKGNSEFSIYCKEEKRLYFYDLTIPSINLIIEYNGYKYHPNPNKLSKEEWKNWKSYNFQKNVLNEIVIDADTAYKNDLYKKYVAESKGFEVFTVWSTDNRIDTNNKIINLINKKLDENNKNN